MEIKLELSIFLALFFRNNTAARIFRALKTCGDMIVKISLECDAIMGHWLWLAAHDIIRVAAR